ncbi:MAG: PqiC family protein [Candidatus Kapabacteria bacterium]|nr:PqiC family protein [Candidatus Kapabacteria bacterium]
MIATAYVVLQRFTIQRFTIQRFTIQRFAIQHFAQHRSTQGFMSLRGLLPILLGSMVMTVFTGCISFKTEYPKTAYYRLEDRAITPSAKTTPDGLLVKPFTIDSEFNTDRIIVMANATEAQPLMYHRWTSEPQELITANLTHRLQQSGFFAGGVFTPASSVIPALQLEGHITECLARTTQEGNVVSLRVHCTVQRIDAAGKTSVVLQKVYTQTARRTSDAGAAIAPAMSEAVSALGDALLGDIARLLTP